MKEIFKHKKLLGLASVFLVIVAAASFWHYNTSASVQASGVVSIDISPGSSNAPGLDAYTTYAVTEKSTNFYEINYPGSGSKIEIGDVSKTSNFKPDLTISTWNKEAEFKLIAPSSIEEKSQLTTSLANDTISASNGEWTFNYKPTTPKDGFNEKGGVDIIITAKGKPTSNKIYFTYDSSTVTPYCQPPLTAEYKDGWSDAFQCEIKVTETQVVVAKDTNKLKAGKVLVERHDYVVGSIAFYANGKSNHVVGSTNYGTGKVGHLYALQCNGKWCRWSVEGRYIVLTIPQEIIDTGKYPVTIAPVGDTFGYSTSGNSLYFIDNDGFCGSVFTATSSGNITNFSVYGYASIGNGLYLKGVLVTHSSLTIKTNGVSPEIDCHYGNGLTTVAYSSQPSISSGTAYVVGLVYSGTQYYWYPYYDTGDTNQGHIDTSNSEASPSDPTDATHNDYKFSAYCTFTPATTAPSVTTNAATSVTTTTATLNGSLTSLGSATSVAVSYEWGTTTNYGNTATGTPSPLTATGTFTGSLTGLTSGTTYHFRAKADGGTAGVSYGADQQFTTTGLTISNIPSSYNFGAVNASSTNSTGLSYFSVTNNSGSAVNITISGTDLTGGTTWTLSDTATPGTNTVGMKAGLNGGAYDIIVKKTTPFNTLKSNLAASASQSWGLQLLAPTSYTDNAQKTGTVTLTATVP